MSVGCFLFSIAMLACLRAGPAAADEEAAKWFVLWHTEIGSCWTGVLIKVDGAYRPGYARIAGGTYDTEAAAREREAILQGAGVLHQEPQLVANATSEIADIAPSVGTGCCRKRKSTVPTTTRSARSPHPRLGKSWCWRTPTGLPRPSDHWPRPAMRAAGAPTRSAPDPAAVRQVVLQGQKRLP